MSSFQRIPATGSADRTVKFWDLETFELIGSGGPENFDPSTKETKAIGRSSKPLGRLSVSQNSDVAKESRTLSSTGSVPSTPHRLSLTCVSKAASGAVYNAAASRRSFTKANQKANPVNKAADFVPMIVPREDPRIEQETESRAELDR
ncbi:hypothetical protein Bca52824_060967 [Brassica carinata]|uniref:Uncharacterized protein n=1 Tax=Brassica carinata TaxID=52824 RepID=A0A8X7QYW4_BRACI|nr:hypothetical protein Bca52824_060967 [Brassica carinata]